MPSDSASESPKPKSLSPEAKAFLATVRKKVRVTKVVATRSVKGQRGDSFAGFSAAWDSVQEDGAMGMEEVGDSKAPLQAMTLKEAQIAGYLLAMQADIAAHEHAFAGGSISLSVMEDAVRNIRTNYLQLVTNALDKQFPQG